MLTKGQTGFTPGVVSEAMTVSDSFLRCGGLAGLYRESVNSIYGMGLYLIPRFSDIVLE